MIKRLTLIALSILIFFGVFHIFVARSEGARLAENYLRNNSLVVEQVGEVSQVILKPLGFELEDYASTGSATYNFYIKGSNKNGDAVVVCKKSEWIWRVERASLTPNSGIEVLLK